MVFLHFPFMRGYKCMTVSSDPVNYHELQNTVISCIGNSNYMLYYNGKKLLQTDVLSKDAVIHVVLSLPGGKGGFGSMLRAIGAQIEKTTNREACRDLSGRRLRDINEEQRIRKWLAKKAEREEEKIRRRKERLERLKAKPKHNFVDFEFEKEISQLPERIDDALTEGLEKTAKNLPEKRVSSNLACSSKKKRLWLEDEVSNESSSSDSEIQENRPLDESDTRSSLDSSDQNNSANCIELENESVTSIKDIFEQNNSSLALESNSVEDDYKDDKSVIESSCSSDAKSATNSEISTESQEKSFDIKERDHKPIEMEEESKKVETESNGDLKDAVADQIKDCDSKKMQEDSPIDLLDFQTASELEAFGLDRLKAALLARGLKCGGNLSDRAQRLWRVRGLQPHEYPSNLLAKGKK